MERDSFDFLLLMPKKRGGRRGDRLTGADGARGAIMVYLTKPQERVLREVVAGSSQAGWEGYKPIQTLLELGFIGPAVNAKPSSQLKWEATGAGRAWLAEKDAN